MSTMQKAKLIIFDIDGTLTERDSDALLPGVAEWFEQHWNEQHNALATNQGGVGLRYWMESGGFGEPSKYPDEDTVYQRIAAIGALLHYPAPYICFAYQSAKSGKWGPVPENVHPGDTRWKPEFRKPSPGLLFQAMEEHHVAPGETLMVGDFMSDKQAAEAAGCHFQWAWEFFGREKPTTEASSD